MRTIRASCSRYLTPVRAPAIGVRISVEAPFRSNRTRTSKGCLVPEQITMTSCTPSGPAVIKPAASRRFHGYRQSVRMGATEPSNGGETSNRLEMVLSKIDEANSLDPRTVEVDGQPQPVELVYSRWLSGWVDRLTADDDPPTSEEVRIVARGQHVERFKTPRNSYPDGKQGYLQWREDLKKAHAARVTGFMREVGYSQESLNKVERLILKKELKQPEGQVIEDALCLVFLEHQFDDLIRKETRESMINILRRTWGKMGPKGHAAALQLPLSPEQADLLGAALAGK